PSGLLHFISYDKVYQVNKGSIDMVYPLKKSHMTSYDVMNATNGDDKSIYISGKNGVICLDPYTLNTKKFLPDKWVNSVTIDKEENIWFMTRGNGIYFLPKQYEKER